VADDDVAEAKRAARAALGPVSNEPPPASVFQPPDEDDPELEASLACPKEGVEPIVERASTSAIGDPVWGALPALKSRLNLVPTGPDGHTRLGQCVATNSCRYSVGWSGSTSPVVAGAGTVPVGPSPLRPRQRLLDRRQSRPDYPQPQNPHLGDRRRDQPRPPSTAHHPAAPGSGRR
jgi:hypothetical protein